MQDPTGPDRTGHAGCRLLEDARPLLATAQALCRRVQRAAHEAVLARLEEQEREIAAQAEATRGRIAELTAQLEEFDQAAEEVRITRKTLLALPDPSPPTPPAAKPPDHPAYRQIMAVFAAADAPLRARAVCEAMDLEIAPSNVNNVRLKLKRLVERGILIEPEQGLFTQPRP
ncbi:hypothetical protein [Streptomyces sp. NPDC048496]|uniref:hypothetical protein n=1 Tax=Streptomyces sp. NPDC048496 TaxID=3365558 RepID=UPI0037226AC5